MRSKERLYWQEHYVIETDPREVAGAIKPLVFASGNERLSLVAFEHGSARPNILVSQGSGGHAYIFAELAYRMHLQGYNVFIMPKHGGRTVLELVRRHADALEQLAQRFGERTSVFAEGLGGYAAFYLALAGGRMQSLALQNAPALLDEEQWRAAIFGTQGAAARRKVFMPILGLLVRAFPNLPLPLSTYLDFGELIDTYEPSRSVEERLVNDGYRKDPDFDRWYRLSAVLSLVTTPPPRPLAALRTPTLFIVARRGFIPPSYFRDLYERLPPISKQLTEVDGSVYWMLSHPSEAAALICGWFARSLPVETASAASAGM